MQLDTYIRSPDWVSASSADSTCCPHASFGSSASETRTEDRESGGLFAKVQMILFVVFPYVQSSHQFKVFGTESLRLKHYYGLLWYVGHIRLDISYRV